MLYALRQTHKYGKPLTEGEDRPFFRKDKMSPNTFVVYTTVDAAERARSQVNPKGEWAAQFWNRYEIVALDNDEWFVVNSEGVQNEET